MSGLPQDWDLILPESMQKKVKLMSLKEAVQKSASRNMCAVLQGAYNNTPTKIPKVYWVGFENEKPFPIIIMVPNPDSVEIVQQAKALGCAWAKDK